MRSYHTTTFIVRILFFWIAAAAAIGQTDEEISRRRYEDKKILSQGDMSPLRRAFEEKNVKLLWAHTLGFDTSVMTREQNRAISAEAARYLSQIPGHTQIIIDRIEAAAEQTKDIRVDEKHQIVGLEKLPETEEQLKAWESLANRARITTAREFNELDQLGSIECVQTLMTYLDDVRCIGLDTGGSGGGYWLPDPNNRRAVRSLQRILKDQSPAKDLMPEGGGSWPKLEPILKRFKQWWASDASKPWRGTIYNTSRSHLLPGTPDVPRAPDAGRPGLEPPRRETQWPILVILCLATLAALLGFSKLRKK